MNPSDPQVPVQQQTNSATHLTIQPISNNGKKQQFVFTVTLIILGVIILTTLGFYAYHQSAQNSQLASKNTSNKNLPLNGQITSSVQPIPSTAPQSLQLYLPPQSYHGPLVYRFTEIYTSQKPSPGYQYAKTEYYNSQDDVSMVIDVSQKPAAYADFNKCGHLSEKEEKFRTYYFCDNILHSPKGLTVYILKSLYNSTFNRYIWQKNNQQIALDFRYNKNSKKVTFSESEILDFIDQLYPVSLAELPNYDKAIRATDRWQKANAPSFQLYDVTVLPPGTTNKAGDFVFYPDRSEFVTVYYYDNKASRSATIRQFAKNSVNTIGEDKCFLERKIYCTLLIDPRIDSKKYTLYYDGADLIFMADFGGTIIKADVITPGATPTQRRTNAIALLNSLVPVKNVVDLPFIHIGYY